MQENFATLHDTDGARAVEAGPPPTRPRRTRESQGSSACANESVRSCFFFSVRQFLVSRHATRLSVFNERGRRSRKDNVVV
jgi:hypothetical protein